MVNKIPNHADIQIQLTGIIILHHVHATSYNTPDRGTVAFMEQDQWYWSRRKKMRAMGYVNTIKLYFDTVNTDRQEEMLHQLQRNNALSLFTGVVN